MVPKFGILTNPSINVVKEIKTISKLGFDFVEICFEEPLGKYDIVQRNGKKNFECS